MDQLDWKAKLLFFQETRLSKYYHPVKQQNVIIALNLNVEETIVAPMTIEQWVSDSLGKCERGLL